MFNYPFAERALCQNIIFTKRHFSSSRKHLDFRAKTKTKNRIVYRPQNRLRGYIAMFTRTELLSVRPTAINCAAGYSWESIAGILRFVLTKCFVHNTRGRVVYKIVFIYRSRVYFFPVSFYSVVRLSRRIALNPADSKIIVSRA